MPNCNNNNLTSYVSTFDWSLVAMSKVNSAKLLSKRSFASYVGIQLQCDSN